ncbi:MAG: phytanoyl-CoA dioxygenase family protein [Candidatus Omnitrophica bacterium]|nr:phytanoyl-CoA dioxygenase family protein [Candidatus Omnitrophota bacterium]
MSDVKEFFENNGYYHAKGVFSPSEIVELEREYDRIVQQIQSTGEEIDATWKSPGLAAIASLGDQVLHTHNVHRYSAAWLRAILHDRFLGVVREILGEDIVLNHTKLFYKPAEKGSPFPMHQDWSYFPTYDDTMMAGIIHVSRATDRMGCLRVYPGSHKLGRIDGTSGKKASDFLDRYPIEDATVVEAEPGDVVFFHYFTLHGSMPNRSEDVRKTVLVQMYAGSDRVEEGCQHPDERIALSGWNSRMTRQLANT